MVSTTNYEETTRHPYARPEIEEISIPLPELLKAHRQKYLFEQHGMLQIPFVNEALEERYASQVSCT